MSAQKKKSLIAKIETFAIKTYNDLAEKIELIPKSAKHAFEMDHRLKLLENDNNPIIKPSDLCNQDVVNFGNTLLQLTDHYNDKIRKCQITVKTENDKISQIKSDLNLINKEVDILNKRISNITNLYNEERSKMSLLTANTHAFIEKTELSISAQSNDIDEQLKNKKKELLEAENEYNKLFEKCKKIEIQLTSKVGIAMEKAIKHRQRIREQLKKVNKTLDDALEKTTFYHIQEPTIQNISEYVDQDNDIEMKEN